MKYHEDDRGRCGSQSRAQPEESAIASRKGWRKLQQELRWKGGQGLKGIDSSQKRTAKGRSFREGNAGG